MRVIAAIQADLDTSTIGTRSRLADEFDGTTVLRRTVDRISSAKRVANVFVLCPAPQFERCSELLDGAPAVVRPYDAEMLPWGALTQTARKWSLDGWRGGIGGTTSFDEYTDCRLLGGLLDSVQAEAVLSVPPAAPLIDPALIDAMIDHAEAEKDDTHVTFTQAPPGLAGVLLQAPLVRELAEKGVPLGWVFSYQPDSPRKDVIFQPCCFGVPVEVRYAFGRLTADTERSMRTLEQLLHDHDSPDLTTIGQWLIDRDQTFVEPLPREVEIELTTEAPFPDALLRPRGSRVEQRGPIDPEIVRKIVAEITRFDDALVVLGGFGDPLHHPRFTSILEAIRVAESDGRRLYGLAVRTNAADLNDELIEALISYEVDILNVTLDAWTAKLYAKMQSPLESTTDDLPPSACADAALPIAPGLRPDLQTVQSGLDRVSQMRQQRVSVKPIVLPEMTKARDNVHELDAFYDGWIRRIGAATVSGYSHFAGQCEDRSVIPMAPTARFGCRRILSRCLVLADGRVAMCDQDFQGLHAAGSLCERSLEEIWQGAALERIRGAHRTGQFDPTPLCAACDEWHRP